MPKQNRPLVRDGRLQAPKKRTDRSYLRPSSAPSDDPLPEHDDALVADEEMLPEAIADVTTEPAPAPAAPMNPEPGAAFAPPPNTTPAMPPPSTGFGVREDTGTRRPASNRLPTAVRALQQQGVRKRRDVDLDALAVRDTNYAVHELRRIAVLTAMVIISLIVLTLVLR